ncbi:MAG: 2-dehydropantoate 2-reductase [Gemmatimonadota bacterium]|jgi:2-dehydropantoate 2-reductase|nr:2-dehydropantoate 2-reductase [Gemmatimonadota bacterium]
MRILVVGAGAVGGYFGGRLLEAGRDVTFLVRPRRAAELARTGLSIRSPVRDLEVPAPPTVRTEEIQTPFDLILLSSKAYDLEGAIESVAPAVGPDTLILPLLNGLRHLDTLDARFGAQKVLGGLCLITSTLDPEGRILHFTPLHTIVFGPRNHSSPPRLMAVRSILSDAGFEARYSDNILQDMWEKWAFIAALAGLTCLMRSPVGDIIDTGSRPFAEEFVRECAAIASRNGFPPSPASVERNLSFMTAPGSSLAASMLRDIERGSRTEAEHLIGDLLRRDPDGENASPLLRTAYAHLKAYETRLTDRI